MIDKKWKISGKVSVIDIAIVVAVIVCAYFGYRFIFTSSAVKPRETTPVVFVMEFRRQPDYLSGKIKVGDVVIDAIKGLTLGNVVKVEEGKSTGETFDEKQEKFILTTVPDYIDVYVTVKADAYVTEEYTMIGTYDIAVGAKAAIKTADFAREGYIVAIEQTKQGD